MKQRDRGETPAILRWEQATYWPLTVSALVFIVVYTIHVIGDVHGLPGAITSLVITLIWVMFVVDYVMRLLLSKPKGVWFRSHLYDLAVALLPVLRPLRLLTAFTHFASFTRTASSSLRSRMLIYGVGAALLIIWYCSLLVLQFERYAPGANIKTFGDALWWAFCTVTTVGYGDYTPVTPAGRVVAVALMMSGVVLVGLIVASFSSWVLERATRGHEEQLPATRADIDRLETMLAQARADAAAADAAPPGAKGGADVGGPI